MVGFISTSICCIAFVMSGWIVELGDTTVQEVYNRIYGERLLIPEIDLSELTQNMISSIHIGAVETTSSAFTILDNIAKKPASELGNIVNTFMLDKLLPFTELGENIKEAFNDTSLEVMIPENLEQMLNETVDLFDGIGDPKDLIMGRVDDFWNVLKETVNNTIYGEFCGYNSSFGRCTDKCAADGEACETCKKEFDTACCVFVKCGDDCEDNKDSEACQGCLAVNCAGDLEEDFCCKNAWCAPRSEKNVCPDDGKRMDGDEYIESVYGDDFRRLRQSMNASAGDLNDKFNSLRNSLGRDGSIMNNVKEAIRAILRELGTAIGDALGAVWPMVAKVDLTILFKCIFFIYNSFLSAALYMCAYLSISAHLILIGFWILVLMLIIRHRGMKDPPADKEEYSGDSSLSSQDEKGESDSSSSSSL